MLFLLNVLGPIAFAGAVGFSHAFEADHLIAVSSLVSRRERVLHAIRDGIFWGLGHTSTIILIGLIMIVGGIQIPEQGFRWMEGLVGLMLVVLGAFRLYKRFIRKAAATTATEAHSHEHHHRLAYGVGFVHGLAGSGALILLVMTEMQGTMNMLGYLVTFGIGSIVGMMVAAGLFSLPTAKPILNKKLLQDAFVIISSLLCLGYGTWLMIESFG